MGVERSPLKGARLTTKHLGRRMCRSPSWLTTRREKLRQPRRHSSSLRGQSPSFVAASLARSFFASKSREEASPALAELGQTQAQNGFRCYYAYQRSMCGVVAQSVVGKLPRLREIERATPWGRCQRRRRIVTPTSFLRSEGTH